MVVALVIVVDVIRLRDVDKPSAPPLLPCWSRGVRLVCLVLVLLSVVAVVLTMLPPFDTVDDVKALLDEPVTTLVVSVVPDVLSIAVVAAALEILFNTVVVTPAV